MCSASPCPSLSRLPLLARLPLQPQPRLDLHHAKWRIGEPVVDAERHLGERESPRPLPSERVRQCLAQATRLVDDSPLPGLPVSHLASLVALFAAQFPLVPLDPSSLPCASGSAALLRGPWFVALSATPAARNAPPHASSA